MKILIISASDIFGGANRAAYRLHKSLLQEGVSSQMLVQEKKTDDDTVLTTTRKKRIYTGTVRRLLDLFVTRLYKKRGKELFSPAHLPFGNVLKRIQEIKPDIVHLQWINDGMMRIEDISKIRTPIIWSMHDMWAFTGGCHYNKECEKYQQNCEKCPALGSIKKHDLSSRIFRRKRKTYGRKQDLTIVGTSSWTLHSAKKSTLLSSLHILNLPTPIDTKKFKPFNTIKARELWNFPKDKKLVLFGAMSATSDPRKGFKELAEALAHLSHKNIELVVFGSSEKENAPPFPFNTYYTGLLHDDLSLITLYNACDAMIVPSLQENLSNAILESLACGTPVVGFNIGGNGDMITHKQNGYLAKPYEIKDLAKGIDWVLTNNEDEELSKNAREKAVRTFSYPVVAKQYIELYKETLSNTKQPLDKN